MNPDDEKNADMEDDNRPSVRGRPPIFNTVEELEDAIDGYFKGGMKKRQVIIGKGDNKKAIMIPMPTITGLVLYLGFSDRASFYDYEKKPDFSHTIKRARTFIENEYEEILLTTGNAGAIFALKNFGWRDERQLSLSDDSKKLSDEIRGFSNDDDGLEPDELGPGESEADDVQDDSSSAAAESAEETPPTT